MASRTAIGLVLATMLMSGVAYAQPQPPGGESPAADSSSPDDDGTGGATGDGSGGDSGDEPFGPTTPGTAGAGGQGAPAGAEATGGAPPAGPPAGQPPAAGAAAGDAAGQAGTAAGDDEDEDEDVMTFTATRNTSMDTFAAKSLREIEVGTVRPRYALNLFGDFSLGALSRSEGDHRKPDPAFAIGVFDMLFSSQLGKQFFLTSEVTFRYEPNNPFVELERLHMRWAPNDYWFVEIGRVHTDIGYWNTAYHLGSYLQTPVNRPRSILLKGGLIPLHLIGASTGGMIPFGKQTKLKMVVGAGSTRDPLSSVQSNTFSSSYTPVNGAHAKIEVEGLGLKNLRFGASGLLTRIASEPAVVRPVYPDERLDERMLGAHIAYPSEKLTFISEGYVIEHKALGSVAAGINEGEKWRSLVAFALLGYRFGQFTPYLMGEYIDSQRSSNLQNPVYVPQPRGRVPPGITLDLIEGSAGVRWDVTDWSAIKLEYRNTQGVGTRHTQDSLGNELRTPMIHTVTGNWSFGI